MRCGRDGEVEDLREVTDAELVLGQRVNDSEPRWVRKEPEDIGKVIYGVGREHGRPHLADALFIESEDAAGFCGGSDTRGRRPNGSGIFHMFT